MDVGELIRGVLGLFIILVLASVLVPALWSISGLSTSIFIISIVFLVVGILASLWKALE